MADEVPLTGEEMRAWLAYINLSTLLGDYLDRQLHRDSGISHGVYHLLAWLSSAPERTLRLSTLAEGMCITRSRLSHMLSKLESDGWVTRVGDSTDGRGQLAILTDAGLKALAAAAPGHARAVRLAVFDKLSPQQVQQLAEIAETILSGLLQENPEAPYPDNLPWRRR